MESIIWRQINWYETANTVYSKKNSLLIFLTLLPTTETSLWILTGHLRHYCWPIKKFSIEFCIKFFFTNIPVTAFIEIYILGFPVTSLTGEYLLSKMGIYLLFTQVMLQYRRDQFFGPLYFSTPKSIDSYTDNSTLHTSYL